MVGADLIYAALEMEQWRGIRWGCGVFDEDVHVVDGGVMVAGLSGS